MRKTDEMNKLEIKGFQTKLREKGWQFCSIGLEGIAGWTKDGFCIAEKDIYYEEE